MAEEPVDFRDLLSSPMTDFPDRPDLPGNATIYGKLLSVAAMSSKDKGTPGLTFSVRATDLGKDVPATWLKTVQAAGFNLIDYPITADFWITVNSMVMLRRFLASLGFPENKLFMESLKLWGWDNPQDEAVRNDPRFGEPTDETQALIRGLDVMVRTPAPRNGRVYNRVDNIVGMKKSTKTG